MFSNKFKIFIITLNQIYADNENKKDTNMEKESEDRDILWTAKRLASVL